MILVRENILKLDLICLAEGPQMLCCYVVMFLCFYVSLDLASVFFLLARSGRKTDGHIINIRMFIKFFMFFFAYSNLPISLSGTNTCYGENSQVVRSR
jgi:hypothetical protein